MKMDILAYKLSSKNMESKSNCYFYALLLFVAGFFGDHLFAQNRDTGVVTLREISRQRMPRAEATDTIFSYQLRKLREYGAAVSEISSWLKKGIDTSGLHDRISKFRSDFEFAREGTEANDIIISNQRNLKSSLILIENINSQLNELQEKMDGYAARAFESQQKLFALKNDSLIRIIPEDDQLTNEYLRRIGEVRQKALPARKELKELGLQLGLYQNEIAQLQLESSGSIDNLKNRLNDFGKRIFKKEEPYLHQVTLSRTGSDGAVAKSWEKAFFTFQVYFAQNWGSRVLIILIVLVCWLLSFLSIRFIQNQHEDEALKPAYRWVRFPLMASVFIGYGFGQFLYDDAPAVYIQYMWGVLALVGTLIFYGEFPRKSFLFWLPALVLYFLVCGNNLIIQPFPFERWMMALLAISAIGLSVAYLYQFQDDNKGKFPLMRALQVLLIAQLVISLLANLAGRYTLSKIMLTGGYFNFISGIILFWMMLLVTDFVFLILDWIKGRQEFSSYLNIHKIREGTRPVLNTIMVFLWVVIFIKNLNLYDPLKDGIDVSLSTPRSIGSFEFTYWSIFTFFIVIYASILISNFINYLLGSTGGQMVHAGGKKKIGGVVLIFRLIIITFGFLLAVAAAGIPIDKVTIVIGALGVGIGFGLQNIVNNLVSGVIIAFERPINIGDQIEVGGRLGKVMEIGIRSSKIATFDGAEVVIPNGDLLNQHLVNWTLSSNNRRIEILVGVRYGADLQKVKGLLEDIVKERKGVIHIPESLVLVNQFGDSSIEFRLLFWTDDISNWISLKSEVLQEIDIVFKEHGIEIPFPQQDIYIKEFKRGE
jgi:potassium-dependent mechanosensitive channel